MTAAPLPDVRYADPVDAGWYGEHRPNRRVPARWADRVSDFVPGRFHVYGAWSSPASHRIAIVRGLTGLGDAVTMSYVDGLRDARGWAFRPATGPDRVNGFTLLREAYLATDRRFDGPVTVPVLWDRLAGRIRSNSPAGIARDLAGDALRPAALAAEIDAMIARVATQVEHRLAVAVYRPRFAERLLGTLRELDAHLARHRYVVADRLTEADVHLWVQVVRYDAGPNAHGTLGPRLDHFPGLWRWARELHSRPAFAGATDLARLAAPLADLPPWDARR